MKNILSLIATLALTAHFAVAAETAPAPAVPGNTAGFTGKVVETMSTAGYTYILVDTGTKKSWAAAPQFTVQVGDKVTVAAGLPMDNYHSKTLNRDFDSVYFTGNITVGDAAQSVAPGAALPEGHPPLKPLTGKTAQLPAGHPEIKGVTDKPTVDLKNIKPAKNGKTVAEIYAGKKKLAGKTVTVRGKVVKYNPDIMGKNWLHVQDGTSNEGDNDLMVTSSTATKIGDTVLVKGVVTLDKDFGAGYRYAVILDDAEVVVE